jgi:hypothetical protein
MLLMGKPTISMAIFNSFLYVYQSEKKGKDSKVDRFGRFFVKIRIFPDRSSAVWMLPAESTRRLLEQTSHQNVNGKTKHLM